MRHAGLGLGYALSNFSYYFVGRFFSNFFNHRSKLFFLFSYGPFPWPGRQLDAGPREDILGPSGPIALTQGSSV